MKNCPIELRKRAIEFFRNTSEIGSDEIYLKKFLYYMDCFCAELKQTEMDILMSDENYDMFYSLFNSVMIEMPLATKKSFSNL